jgi:uncharacterized membrane protein
MIFALRLVHILSGIFWVGSLLFITGFLMPSVRAAGPAGGAVMGQLMQVRKLHHYMMGATLLTIVSGFGLVYVLAGPLGFQWFTVGMGRAIGIGALLTLVATAIGFAVNAPTAQRIAKLAAGSQAAGRPPTPDEAAQMQALQGRLGRAAVAVTTLLVLAAACMAVARYL